MKISSILTGVSALVLSVAGANAETIKPFAGLTLGLQGVGYSDEADGLSKQNAYSLPNDYINFGIEGGIRFGEYNEIYNGGLTVAVDFSDVAKIGKTFSEAQVGKLYTRALSMTYDNYIRISGDKSSRIDLVLGVGAGETYYKLTFDNGLSGHSMYSPSFVFKAGMDFELSEHFILSGVARLFTPTSSHYYFDTQYIVGGGIKYVF